SATTVYWLYFSPWRVPFSVKRTVLITSKAFMLFPGQTGLDLLKRALREEQLVGPQNVVSVQRIARGQRDIFNVARGEHEIFVRRRDDEGRAGQIQRGHQADEILRLRRGEFQIVHQHHVTGLEPFAQRLAQREGAGLLGNFFAEIAGPRTEDHATTHPQRRLMGTGARAARALLPPRLLVAAGNFAD